MSHRHADPFDPQESYGMPSRPCIVCRCECCVDCAEPRPTAEDPRALKCWDCVEDERAAVDERIGAGVVETHSITIEGPPLTGTCSSCGADLDALARTGVTGHECYGPGDATNHREPS
jgi:hypothetical protein